MAKNNSKKNKKKIIAFSAIGVIAIFAIILAAASGGKEKIVIVQTEKAKKRTIIQTVGAIGKIQPETIINITPEVTGEVVELPVIEGDRVKKGSLLIRIKPDAYIAAKERAQANLEAARANLNMSKANFEKVEFEFRRMEELFKKGLSSSQEYESIKALYLSNRFQVEAQSANVKQAEAMLKEAIENLSKTAIYSPIDGIISKLNVKLGERVLGSGFSQGTLLMQVADMLRMEAIVEVDENDVVLLQIGNPVKIEIDAIKDKIFNGEVYRISNSAITKGIGSQDEVVNFEVRIRLKEYDEVIKPGMSCYANIETRVKTDVVSVPLQAATVREKKTEDKEKIAENENYEIETKTKRETKKANIVVFVVEDSKAKLKNVKTGISDDKYIEIVEGLQEGEEAIIGPFRAVSKELEDGVTVKVDKEKIKVSSK